MTENTKACPANSNQESISLTSLNNNYAGSNSSYHKSFDFSNINLDKTSGVSQLKQFHQTRLYIKNFENMLSNGSQIGGKNSTYIISANLPQTFSYSIGSKWSAPLSEFGSSTFNLLMQLAGPVIDKFVNKNFGENLGLNSGINRATTMKIWGGSESLKLTLNIPVIDDDYTNTNSDVKVSLAEALEFLGCLCLPKESGEIGFYTPPPSPLAASIKWSDTKTFEFNPTSARIILQLGGMLLVDNCIVENINVNYTNTKAQMYRNNGNYPYLSPIIANISITISTIEALTSRTYGKMLTLKQQEDQGKGNADISKFGNKVEGMFDSIVNSNNKQEQPK